LIGKRCIMSQEYMSEFVIKSPGFGVRVLEGIEDTVTIAGRDLIGVWRTPQLFLTSLFGPVLFVLLFRYVFGGAIDVSSVTTYPYVDYLMPGIFVITLFFGIMVTATGLASDVESGLLERFRSLPMARSAFMSGRTLADLVRNVGILAFSVGFGFAVGFRVHTSTWVFLGGLLLALLFAYSISWFFCLVGLVFKNPEAADAASSFVVLPLLFASSAFVPVSTMPGWLQGFARYQPVSVAVSAMRALSLGGPVASSVWQTLAWSAGIVAVCAPLSIWWYTRSA
jgi:ABC transporter DrrB family efflux protein